MTSESLEPCPFCGARELTITYAIGTEIRHRCDGRVDRPLVTVTAQTEDAAFSAWNTRARPPAQGVDVGKLRSMWDDADDWHTKRAAFELALQALSPSSERLTSAIAQLDAGEGVEREVAAQASSEGDERSCTCHPDDAVEPCARKYAASECAARAQASLLPPVGWVMVPAEPTEAMIDAAEAALGEWRKTLSPDEAILRRSVPTERGRVWLASATTREKAAIRYAAMLAAAPPFSKLCLGGAERSDCETNPNTTSVLGASHG